MSNIFKRLIAKNRERRLSICVVGDAMVDVYVHGKLGKGQEPCAKFVKEYSVSAHGGAANSLAQLGAWNVDRHQFCQDTPNRSVKTRFLENGKIVFRYDDDLKPWVSQIPKMGAAEVAAFFNGIDELDGILISDYDKGFLTDEAIRKVIRIANDRRIPVVSDPKRKLSVYNRSIIKCNEAYYEHSVNFDVDRIPDSIVVTRGNENPVTFTRPGEFQPVVRPYPEIPPGWSIHPHEVNHVGAGDCFASHLLLVLCHGFHLQEAATIAHSAGRVYVQHPHNRAPYPHEIYRDAYPTEGKILDRESAATLRASTGDRLIFTNGVFRVPHAGHAWLMEWAKTAKLKIGGNPVLVVGVNSDASARRLRPGEFVLPLEQRMQMIASMGAVDWVIPFDEDTPAELMSELKPNVLVKGSHYAGSIVPGAEHAMEVAFAPEGPFFTCSSSKMVSDIETYR